MPGRCASAELPVDCRGWKAEPLKCPRGARIAEPRARPEQFFDRRREPLVLGVIGATDRFARRIAVDAAAHQFGNETGVAHRLGPPIDEQSREERVVDEPVSLARRDGRPDFVVVVTATGQARPQLRFGQPALRQQAECGEARRR